MNTLFSPSCSAPLSPLLLVFTHTPPKKETLSTKMADITRGCCHDLSTYCSYLCTYPNCRKLCTTPQLKETLHTITIKKTAIPYVQKSVKNAPEISHCGAQVVIKKVKKIPTHPGAFLFRGVSVCTEYTQHCSKEKLPSQRCSFLSPALLLHEFENCKMSSYPSNLFSPFW